MNNSGHHYNKTIHICNWFCNHWIHNTILHIKSLEPEWHWDLCKDNLIEFGWYDFTSSDPHVSWLLHSFMILWLFTPWINSETLYLTFMHLMHVILCVRQTLLSYCWLLHGKTKILHQTLSKSVIISFNNISRLNKIGIPIRKQKLQTDWK